MSRSFGKNQIKIIEYLEEFNFGYPIDVIKNIADHKPPTKADRSKIYRAIQRLKEEDVLIECRIKNLYILGSREYRTKKHPKPKPLKINKENKAYKLYKIKKSTLNDL